MAGALAGVDDGGPAAQGEPVDLSSVEVAIIGVGQTGLALSYHLINFSLSAHCMKPGRLPSIAP